MAAGAKQRNETDRPQSHDQRGQWAPFRFT